MDLYSAFIVTHSKGAPDHTILPQNNTVSASTS